MYSGFRVYLLDHAKKHAGQRNLEILRSISNEMHTRVPVWQLRAALDAVVQTAMVGKHAHASQ